MIWATFIWAMVASACLTLGGMYTLVWCRNRAAWANLFVSLTALATASLAVCEFHLTQTRTPEEFGDGVRWVHVPAWALVLALVGFVRFRLRSGRSWLAWTVCGIRTVVLLLNFLVGENLNFLEISRLRPIPYLDGSYAVAEGIWNPCVLVGLLSLVLLAVYVGDAALTVWRRGDRRLALIVGGGVLLLSLAGSLQGQLALWGGVPMPVAISFFSLGMLLAMGSEMSRGTLRADQLAEELRESQERMALAVEVTGIGVWMWSIDSNQVWGSDRWLGLFGFAPGAVVTYEQVIQRIHPDDREAVERGVARSAVDRSDYWADFRVMLPDGSQRWVVARGRAHPAANGRPLRMLGTAIDISERKQMELTLAESEQSYRTLFESAPEGIAMIGPDGCILAANTAQARLYGYDSVEQLKGVYAPMCVAEKDRERSREIMLDVLQGKTRAPRRYTAVRLDGSEFIVEVTSSSLLGPRGEVRGYLCLTRDITESERTEAALKESENRFRQVAEIAGEFIWEVDPEGLYTYASPSVGNILGYAPDELVGKKHFYDLFVPAVREELRAAAFHVFAQGLKFRNFPNANLSKSGKVLNLETSGDPIMDAEGHLAGYRGVDTDVTERTRTQAEIAEQRSELAHLSRVTMLGELAGSLAHELNQPLAAILSNAQAAQRFLAEDNVDLNEVHDILRDIVTDDQRAGEIIRRLRLLLKKGEVQHGRLDVNEVAQDVLRMIRSDLLNHSVRLRTNFARSLPVVEGDRVQLQQVLLNLIMNAIDAMAQTPPVERQLLVRTERTREGDVCVQVSDHGVGLGSDVLEKIFSPYFTTKSGGMGMGLKVCRTIIEAHGGRIEGDNNPDRGASFHIILPVAEKETP